MTLTEIAVSRIVAQYRNKSALEQWISINPDIGEAEIIAAASIIEDMYNIDTAEGEQLDIIARVVGINKRPLVAQASFGFFGYDDTPGATAYDVAPYAAPDTNILEPVSDSIFRTLIKAKNSQNYSTVTIDKIIEVAEIITGYTGLMLRNYENMTFDITTPIALDAVTQYLVDEFDIIPRPQGVDFLGIFEVP